MGPVWEDEDQCGRMGTSGGGWGPVGEDGDQWETMGPVGRMGTSGGGWGPVRVDGDQWGRNFTSGKSTVY